MRAAAEAPGKVPAAPNAMKSIQAAAGEAVPLAAQLAQKRNNRNTSRQSSIRRTRKRPKRRPKRLGKKRRKRLRKNPGKAGEAANIEHAGCMIQVNPIIGFRIDFILKLTNSGINPKSLFSRGV